MNKQVLYSNQRHSFCRVRVDVNLGVRNWQGIKLVSCLIVALLVTACNGEGRPNVNPNPQMDVADTTDTKVSLSFLALGDSYTIGESVEETMRWPVLLANQLTNAGYEVDTVRIIATTGWTTAELKEGIAQANVTESYNLVSLLIGVNNQYRGEERGYSMALYEQEFTQLLEQAIGFADGQTKRVFVVSIPDYAFTPFGQGREPETISRELDEYNAKAKSICEQYGVRFYNITPISREGLEDPELVAQDQLHPSGKQYRRWVQEVLVPDFILPLE